MAKNEKAPDIISAHLVIGSQEDAIEIASETTQIIANLTGEETEGSLLSLETREQFDCTAYPTPQDRIIQTAFGWSRTLEKNWPLGPGMSRFPYDA